MKKKPKINNQKDFDTKSSIVLLKEKDKPFPKITKDKFNRTNNTMKYSVKSLEQKNILPNINSNQSSIQPNLDFENHDNTSENIKVCIRIRPMNLQEKGRNDMNCVDTVSSNQLIFKYLIIKSE